jgi:uncharacterized protein involved in exopolysaccharide biosynthesis/Mrp family chromosome partitioning ATPase
MSSGVRLRELPDPDPASDGKLDLGTLGSTLWRTKWWVLIPGLVVAAATVIGVNLITPRFKSEARVLINTRENVFVRPEAEKTAERERAVVEAGAVQSQVQLVLSRDLARQVIRQLKLNEKPEFDPVLRGFNPLRQVLMMLGLAKDPLRMTPEERVLESYYERVNAYPVDKPRLIAIEYQSADPELAARGANAVAERYLALQQAVKQDQTRAAARWLAGEIEGLRRKVADADAKAEAAKTGEQGVQLRALEREAKAQRDLLESYLAKHREASARGNLGATPADARIISRAVVSNTPHFPKKMPIVLIATLAALLLGVGFITTGELLAGNGYRSGMPAHPAVPVPEALRSEPDCILADPAAAAAMAGQWQKGATVGSATIDDLARSLRAAGGGARRILIAGLVEDADSAGTAVALARRLAEHGRVVMVDLAFASPRLATVAGDGPAAGMADLVRGTASFGQIIARDRSSRAHVIGAGRVGADCGAILASERLAIAIDALGRSYEHVVLDTGAMREAPADRFARLASQAVLVTAGAAHEVVQMARNELTAAGFAGVHPVDEAMPSANVAATSPPRAIAA